MKRSPKQWVISALACLLAISAGAEEKLIVHEWGTFTCLQDENGKGIGGIKVEDVPVRNHSTKLHRGRFCLWARAE